MGNPSSVRIVGQLSFDRNDLVLRWRVKRILRLAALVAIPLAALMLYGCSSDASSTPDEDAGSSTAAQSQASNAQQPQTFPMPVDPAAPVAISATDPQVFEGQGNTQTARFDIADGVLYMKASHQGSADFSVRILTERHLESKSATGGLHSGTGSPRGLVMSIETTGAYDGVRAHQVSPAQLFGLTPGTYLMQVTADGTWRVELTQPVWDSGEAPPFNWSGVGDDVKGPINLETGTKSVAITHSGSSIFVVELVNADGTLAENLVNIVGSYDGSVDVKIHSMIGLTPDIYGLVITADGEWTVDFGE
jgi:hypothetical protein